MNRALKGVLWTLGASAGLLLGARMVRGRGPRAMPLAEDVRQGMPSGLRRLDVAKILTALDLAGGQHVLALGVLPERVAGAIADALGAKGRLLAFDSRPLVLRRLLAAVPGLTNLTTQVADPRDLPCPDGTLDRLLVASGFGGLPDPAQVAREAFRVLKPHGRLVVVEGELEAANLPERHVLDLALAAGFVLRARRGGDRAYMLVFERPAAPRFLHAPHEEHRIETYG